MAKLAIKGGEPIRTKLFPAYNTIGKEEEGAVQKVLQSGNLSQYLGAYHDDFFGGPKVREFEALWSEYIGSKFSISVNSNTSGLYTAIGALGVGPGDEVIVSPYTMTASAIAPMIYGGVPVFADIDPKTCCLDPESIEAKITPRTKAIIAVHIFGYPADMDAIMRIAKKHNIKVIEDCAQAPGAEYMGKKVGVLGDIGIFSFNYHKHIHTGEGGVITTNDAALAERCQLIRNHAEAVVDPKGVENITNLFGYNYRMPEIEAAIAMEQMKKLNSLLDSRISNVSLLESHLKDLTGTDTLDYNSDNKHVYYIHPLKYHAEALKGVSRQKFIEAIKAEIPSSILRETTGLIGGGYMKPLYLQPIYQQRAATCSFNCSHYQGTVDYSAGICPVAEKFHFETLITHEYMRPGMSESDLKDVANAFEKVTVNIEELL